jgi:hypothetical protein
VGSLFPSTGVTGAARIVAVLIGAAPSAADESDPTDAHRFLSGESTCLSS